MNFNVSESGYYKLCNCKFSANAPFCNGTHRDVIRYYHKTHRGFYEIWGYISFYLGFGYMFWNCRCKRRNKVAKASPRPAPERPG